MAQVASWTAVPRRRHRSRYRVPLIVGGSIVFVVVLAIVLANLASSGDNSKPAAKKPGKPAAAKAGELKLVLGKVNVQNTGPPAKVKAPVREALLAATQTYVDDAILAPLEQGAVVNRYQAMFDPGVKSAAMGPDHGVLTEAKTGVAKGPVHATASPVVIDAIGDQTGKPALVATTFIMTVKATTPAGPMTIRRLTEFTFANEFGRWVVTAYNVGVRRTVGATTQSKTATTGDSIPNGTAI
jgi:hypothetical protein